MFRSEWTVRKVLQARKSLPKFDKDGEILTRTNGRRLMFLLLLSRDM